MRNEQLHRPLNNGARLPVNMDMEGKLLFKDVGGLPCFYWPDGRFNFEVSSYIQWQCLNKKTSLTLKGGTASQYAFQLSPLVRFMSDNGLGCLDMTDSYFDLFVRSLEAKVGGKRIRGNPKVREIGSRCLDFLSFTTRNLGFPSFVSLDGVLTGYKITAQDRRDFRERYHKLDWYHFSFPTGGADKQRFPIGEDSIRLLREQAYLRSRHVKARLITMISVMEFSGARRYEVARLRVRDVVRAHQSSDPCPLVRFETVKRGVVTFRFIPIPREVVSNWIAFIETSRLEIIDKTIGIKNDHGFVFVSSNKGTPLSADTITNDIHDLKVDAGIGSPAHAHLFRHRFITEQLKNLIVTYGVVNNAGVRSIVASSEWLKLRLKEWSGHRSVKSLETYLTLAFEELNMIEQVVDTAILATSVLSAKQALERNEADFERKLVTENEYHQNLADIIKDTAAPFKSWLASM